MLQQPTPQSVSLLAIVESILSKNASGGSPRRPQVLIDGDLVEVGMTSVDMVNLMLAVEAEFDITIPPADITPQNFRSITAISSLLRRLNKARV